MFGARLASRALNCLIKTEVWMLGSCKKLNEDFLDCLKNLTSMQISLMIQK